jgi:uncharacterized membrane protein YciS (DUF1049 family)
MKNDICAVCRIESQYFEHFYQIDQPYSMRGRTHICAECNVKMTEKLHQITCAYVAIKIASVQNTLITGDFDTQPLTYFNFRKSLMLLALFTIALTIFNTVFAFIVFPYMKEDLLLSDYVAIVFFVAVNCFALLVYLFAIGKQINNIYATLKLSSKIDQQTYVDYTTHDRSERKSPK